MQDFILYNKCDSTEKNIIKSIHFKYVAILAPSSAWIPVQDTDFII